MGKIDVQYCFIPFVMNHLLMPSHLYYRHQRILIDDIDLRPVPDSIPIRWLASRTTVKRKVLLYNAVSNKHDDTHRIVMSHSFTHIHVITGHRFDRRTRNNVHVSLVYWTRFWIDNLHVDVKSEKLICRWRYWNRKINAWYWPEGKSFDYRRKNEF